MKKKLCGLLLIAMLATGCGKIPKLENGTEAVVTFENGEKISVDTLYDQIKNTYGLTSLMTLIDTYVLETTFPDYVDKAKDYAESYIKTISSNFETEEEFVSALRSNLGIESIDAYQKQIYISYMQSHASEEYAKTLVTDKEIEKYYKNETVGDIEVSHILITPDVTDSMTDEDKTKAENNAKAEAEEIIKTLKNTKKADLEETFKTLAKEHSDDTATKDNGGSLGKINKNTLTTAYDELVKAAYSINDGDFYSKVVTTELGYHVILRTKSYDKASLEDSKEKIKSTLAEQKLSNDSSLIIKALQNYRKELGMDIQDSELQKQYSNLIQNQLAAAKTNNTNN